jgi:hypothetical protein
MNENNKKYADAAFELGAKYYAGNGLSQNYSKVLEYFQIVSRKVIGVPETPELAENYFRQAADIDNSTAAFYLGVLKMAEFLVILAKFQPLSEPCIKKQPNTLNMNVVFGMFFFFDTKTLFFNVK